MEQHVIKVRYKSPALAFVVALCLCLPGASQAAGCDKTPRDQYAAKTDGNNGFAIQINGSPRLYRPNQIYTITLRVNIPFLTSGCLKIGSQLYFEIIMYYGHFLM